MFGSWLEDIRLYLYIKYIILFRSWVDLGIGGVVEVIIVVKGEMVRCIVVVKVFYRLILVFLYSFILFYCIIIIIYLLFREIFVE